MVRDLNFNLSLRPHPVFKCASSEGSRYDDIARICFLLKGYTARIDDNHKNSPELAHLLTVKNNEVHA